jgi:hypothetical protein
MMSPTDTRALMVALRTADYKYLAVRPADAVPKTAPAIVLSGSTANDLAYAMVTAGQVWPQCVAWTLIGSDQMAQLSGADWAPTMHALQMPATLTTFTTT